VVLRSPLAAHAELEAAALEQREPPQRGAERACEAVEQAAQADLLRGLFDAPGFD
jgi:hypothetical protein